MNSYKIRENSGVTEQFYGCFVDFILLLFPAISGILQMIHLIYRYFLYVKHYDSMPYLNHIGNGDFLLIYVCSGVACLAALLLIVCICFEWRHTGFESKLSEFCSHSFMAYMIGAVVLLLMNLVPMAALWWMHEQKIVVSYGEFIAHRSADQSTHLPKGGAN